MSTSRCWWCGDDPQYVRYHDEEWGRPVAEDRRLFEKLCLEGFQSGLSWLTILRKRDAFRAAFHDFVFEPVAGMTDRDVKRLLGDAAIVRHEGKIRSVINNAQRAIELIETEGSLASFVWAFEPKAKERPRRVTRAAVEKLAQTDASRELSRALKRRGFTYVGPTTAYAFMQSMGVVNDHVEGCDARARAEKERGVFMRPAADLNA